MARPKAYLSINSLACVVVILLSQRRLQGAAVMTCDGDGPCRCMMNDGSGVVDISTLGFQNGSARFPDVAASFDGQLYSYNPCYPMSEGRCTNAAACKIADDTQTVMGEQTQFTWYFTGYYPLVTYSTSDGRKTEVMFICDENITSPQLDVIGEVTPGTLSLNLWTMCACPNKCPAVMPPAPHRHDTDAPTLTTGYIVLIVFFSLFFVYFVFGSVINYCRRGTLSKEILPNYSLWSSIPSYAMDGCRCVFGCVGNKKANYDAI
ncbi:cation-dependent mannose-6-phosphate receptor [Biomphalaria glabrata]|nr:cation-dependent mannose-6-phosphate receptor [Biomphalaria glabrata]